MIYTREFKTPTRVGDMTPGGLSLRVDNLERTLASWFLSHQAPGALKITQTAIDASEIGTEEPDTGGFTSLTFTLDLTASGSGKFFYADWSNATLTSRFIFKSSTTNGATGLIAVPNGTGTDSGFRFHNAADPTNSAFAQIAIDSTNAAILRASKTGTGTYGDIDFQTDGTTSRTTIQASTGYLLQKADLVLPKTSGKGIRVDTAAPTFPWHDMLGPISIRGVGAGDPSYNVYQGGIRGYQFDVNEEVFVEFHIPHDYLPGSDIHIHAHWSVKQTTTAGVATNAVTGGSVTWGFEVTYAKGHNQAAFPAPVTTTVAQNASTTQYQHMIAEVQLSAASPSASQIDTDDIEVDGMILVRAYLSANNLTVSAGSKPAPFLHMVDIHYQSTNVGTKQKAPGFYT